MKDNVGLFLAKRAHMSPKVEAFVNTETLERLTYDELNRRSNRIANAFVAEGIQPGERVALLMMNSVEFVETFFALAKIGAVHHQQRDNDDAQS